MRLYSIKNGLSAHRLNAYAWSFMRNVEVLIVDDYPRINVRKTWNEVTRLIRTLHQVKRFADGIATPRARPAASIQE
jgi:hypothetical protein